MKHITVIYHAECYDGLLAAYAAWLNMGDSADYLPMAYGDPVPEELTGMQLYMVDFSVSPGEARKLCAKFRSVEIIDHHISAIQKFKEVDSPLPNNLHLNFDTTKAGCILSAERFLNHVPWFFEYVGDWDIWKFKYPETKEFTAGFFAKFPLADTTFDALNDLLGTAPRKTMSDPELAMEQNLCSAGQLLLKAFDSYVQEFLKFAQFGHDDRARPIALLYNVPRPFISEVGNAAIKKFPDVDYVLIANFVARERKNMVNVSLRSDDDHIDVSEIAKTFGGGGHRNAAGYEIPKQMWLDDPHNRFLNTICACAI